MLAAVQNEILVRCFVVVSILPRCFFFFSSRRRHTRSDRDWSSDVCSSDLEEIPARMQARAADDLKKMVTDRLVDAGLVYEGARGFVTPRRLSLFVQGVPARQIGRASCRERV